MASHPRRHRRPAVIIQVGTSSMAVNRIIAAQKPTTDRIASSRSRCEAWRFWSRTCLGRFKRSLRKILDTDELCLKRVSAERMTQLGVVPVNADSSQQTAPRVLHHVQRMKLNIDGTGLFTDDTFDFPHR